MQLDAGFAIRVRLGFALLLGVPVVATADSSVAVPVEVDAVVFKENGRIAPQVVAACPIEDQLRRAVRAANSRRQVKKSGLEPRHVTLRVDKLGNLGSLGSIGTEFGVTAIPAGREAGQLFLCQDNSRAIRTNHCERITYCAERFAKDISLWLGRTKP